MMEENAEVKVSEATENNGIGAAAAGAGAAATDSGNALPLRAATTAASPSPPVLVFLNSASGGKMGPKVLEKIRVLIPESQ